ncbi:hypothetical protein J7I80_21460 [Bacillus sp. ISL-41]|uniref:hypothetical protein n=1 Tax=Bacillus sp. ISL-41 TaxID=2819127 RepID=UPI001BE75E7E|nr:hypothetical protein [Bacillus sp. ISL-41]MBT2644788.1 hypothetical protein [Bacillus sp. ISL-41]
MNQKVEYDVLNVKDVPTQIQNEISTNSQREGFSIHHLDNYTYVYYKIDSRENEYISTDLYARKEKDIYIITSVVDWATNDDLISYEKVIKLEKVPENDDVVLKEKDKR